MRSLSVMVPLTRIIMNNPVFSDNPDPVLERRTKIARWARVGRYSGYSLYGLSLLILGMSQAVGLSVPSVTAGAVVVLIVCTVLLCPCIIVGYAVKAADRADRENSW